MKNELQSNPPGYRFNDPALAAAPISSDELDAMKEAVLFAEQDAEALRRSKPILVPRTEEILDVWYGFVGSKSFLLEHFSLPDGGAPLPDYLARVRARFGVWIRDTADAHYDETWLRWQFEIGRRHHRVGKNRSDDVKSSALIPFRYLTLLAQPIVDTLRPFLESAGDDRATVDAMHNAWRKSVLLQVTLWSHPYIHAGDY